MSDETGRLVDQLEEMAENALDDLCEHDCSWCPDDVRELCELAREGKRDV